MSPMSPDISIFLTLQLALLGLQEGITLGTESGNIGDGLIWLCGPTFRLDAQTAPIEPNKPVAAGGVMKRQDDLSELLSANMDEASLPSGVVGEQEAANSASTTVGEESSKTSIKADVTVEPVVEAPGAVAEAPAAITPSSIAGPSHDSQLSLKEKNGEEILINGVVQWQWLPFVDTGRNGVYSMNPIGVEWLTNRLLVDYDKIEGPQGVSLKEYEKQLKSNRLTFKKKLADEFMSHFKKYDLTKLLPANPSKSQLKAADNRVLNKIDNILRDRHKKPVRKMTARDYWAKSNPTYKTKEVEHMIKNGWTEAMDRQTAFPIEMQSRWELWDELSEEEKEKWEAEAMKQKHSAPTRAELLDTMAELWALVGDAWVARTGWYMEIRTAGIGEDNLPHFFAEKFKPIVAEGILDFGDIPESEQYDISMRKLVATLTKVKPEDVKDVPPWKLKASVLKPQGRALIKLTGTVHTNDKGDIVSPEDALREAIINYMNMTFALCPVSRQAGKGRPSKPNWNHMWLKGMDNFVDPKVLPPVPFVFDNPERLKDSDLQTLGMWLLKAELGQLPLENCFRWKGQQEGAVIGVSGATGGVSAQKTPIDAILGGTVDVTAHEVQADECGSDSDSKRVEFIVTNVDNVPMPGTIVTIPVVSTKVGGAIEKKPTMTRKRATAPSESKPDVDVVPPPVKRCRGRPPSGKVTARKDAGSDVDDFNASEALVVKGQPTETFNGDMSKWLSDFMRCRDCLDWAESLIEGPMGCPVPLSARFIDAMEVRTLSVLGAQLDITAPEHTAEESVMNLIDEVLLASNTLPTPSIVQMQGVKKGVRVFEVLFQRAEELLLAISTFATVPGLCVLRIGGHLALFPGLHAVELLRQYVHIVDKDVTRKAQVDSLLERYDSMLAQEAWRCWVIMSFEQSVHSHGGKFYEVWLVWMETVMRGGLTAEELMTGPLVVRHAVEKRFAPKIIDDIAHIAARRVRPIQTDDFGVPYADITWKKEDIRLGMEAWQKEMSKEQFKHGCVVERFLWVYGLYMVTAPGGQYATKWCKQAIAETVGWLVEMIKEREPEIVEQRPMLFSEIDAITSGKSVGKKAKKKTGIDQTALLMNASNSSAVVPMATVIRTTHNPRSKAKHAQSPT
ncbi:hypothetical protein M422DRAFT_54651 [Sphaerobolus stellatus SS14]|uniref:Uncharacterized protein n=1 Tax=Sphaerobolus stellatus (strain SS14) TaxID=990650 RepID=A0A0C9U2H0_SPHS4|nr:hypothetical protein M422DRAFT_54651 [Sphaerobolus stellatus SS14]